jgi:prepilin-type N-terminal cleavage/methylation domain-containing protein
MNNLNENYCNENCRTAQLLADTKSIQVGLQNQRGQFRLGFTLVELLVVVAIIGILATLVTAAAFRVMTTTRITAARMKINDIEMALEMYKNKFGEYPPMLSDTAAVTRHIKKRWPRCNVTAIPTDGDKKDSLVFWLGGFTNEDGKYCGFSVDKTNPFGVVDGGTSDKYDNEVFIELYDDKNVLPQEIPEDLVNSGESNQRKRIIISIGSTSAPVVYFRGKKGGGSNAYRDTNNPDPTDNIWRERINPYGVASPYLKSNSPDDKWHNPETYQLIHPGADGLFGGTPKENRVTDGRQLDDGDYDNITNLGTSTIEAMLP